MPRARFSMRSRNRRERLLDNLADAMAAYLRAQAEAGAQALMLFESWAGLLGAAASSSASRSRAVRRTVAAPAARSACRSSTTPTRAQR